MFLFIFLKYDVNPTKKKMVLVPTQKLNILLYFKL